MTRNLVHTVILTVLFPLLLGAVVYYGFGTNYTRDSFHEEGFRAQYEQSIHKYRVLGRLLLLETHSYIAHSETLPAEVVRKVFSNRLPASVEVLDPKADSLFYASFFLLNTAFLSLATAALWLLLARQTHAGNLTTPSSQATIPVMTGTLLMALAQYVVCPYDTLSYALLLTSFFLIAFPLRFGFAALLLVLVISTLTRETSALTLSFYFAFHYRELMQLQRNTLLQLLALIAAFLATYLGLRLALGFDHAIFQSVQMYSNFTDAKNLMGLMLLPVVGWLLCAGSANLTTCLVFILASAPYLFSIVFTGITWEIRLWVPVWLGLLVLGSRNTIHPTTKGSPP